MFFDTLVQVTACESNKTLLVHNWWLSFTQFQILFDLVADKQDGPDSRTNLLAQLNPKVVREAGQLRFRTLNGRTK